MERYGWVGSTMRRLLEIMQYPDRLNEFGSVRVTAVPVREVVGKLFQWMAEETLAPRIIPTSEGGLILEWMEYWVDLQVVVRSDGLMVVTLDGDREFLRNHGYEPEVTSESGERVFQAGIKLLEMLRKEGAPDVPAQKPNDRGAAQASASAGT